MAICRGSIDAELAAALPALPIPDVFTKEIVKAVQADPSLSTRPDLPTLLEANSLIHTERRIPGPTKGDPEIIASIFTPKAERSSPRPCYYFIHGGGYVLPNRFAFINYPLKVAATCDVVCVSVEYRLAPDHPFPAGTEDSYAGLLWVAEHAKELGIDPSRIVVGGQSAGGGLAAAVALMSRDRNGPKLIGQFLDCPMLDDRDETVSTLQHGGGKPWSRASNIMAWEALLGSKKGGPDVSIYAAPARANVEQLAGLPPTFIDVGGCEVFRDEVVVYASKLYEAGIATELHVWPGAYHGFDALCPKAIISQACIAAQTSWMKRIFSVDVASLGDIIDRSGAPDISKL